MSSPIDISTDEDHPITPPPPRDMARELARLRGDKRNTIQALRRHCLTRLAALSTEDQDDEAVTVETFFCTECKDYCAINDRRLGDPRFDSVPVLGALHSDFMALYNKYSFVMKLPQEFLAMLEEENVVTEEYWVLPNGGLERGDTQEGASAEEEEQFKLEI